MRSNALYLSALLAAAIGAAIVAFSLFFEPLRDILVRPLTLMTAAVVIVLFLRALFDARVRKGIDAVNIELRGGKPWPGRILPRPFDLEWGLFGSRMGDRPLQVIRVVCFAEFILALVFSRHDRPDLLLLAAASFGVTIMLTIIHVGLNTKAQQF
jgi:hypothetical protein